MISLLVYLAKTIICILQSYEWNQIWKKSENNFCYVREFFFYSWIINFWFLWKKLFFTNSLTYRWNFDCDIIFHFLSFYFLFWFFYYKFKSWWYYNLIWVRSPVNSLVRPKNGSSHTESVTYVPDRIKDSINCTPDSRFNQLFFMHVVLGNIQG